MTRSKLLSRPTCKAKQGGRSASVDLAGQNLTVDKLEFPSLR